jgi:hypothetical protein
MISPPKTVHDSLPVVSAVGPARLSAAFSERRPY